MYRKQKHCGDIHSLFQFKPIFCFFPFQRVHSSPPPAAVAPSSCSDTAPPHYPASPSPFRFAGQTPAHFSPSLFSPSPSPPRVSPSPRVGSPQCSLSSASGRGAVLSLEELFSEEPHSEISAATSDGKRSSRNHTRIWKRRQLSVSVMKIEGQKDWQTSVFSFVYPTYTEPVLFNDLLISKCFFQQKKCVFCSLIMF